MGLEIQASQSYYDALVDEKTLEILGAFSGSTYWNSPSGSNRLNEGIVVALDWIPYSGSIKLLEMNTNVSISENVGGHLELSRIVNRAKSGSYSGIVYMPEIEDDTNSKVKTVYDNWSNELKSATVDAG